MSMKSMGSSDVGATLGKVGEPEPVAGTNAEAVDDRWSTEAGMMLLNGLMRIFSSGNIPAEVHVDGSKMDALKSMDLVQVLESHLPDNADKHNLLQVAQWWNQNRHNLRFTPRDGFLYPVVISVAEQAEADVFTAVLQHLQSKGLERALASLGVDIQTLMRSPKLFQETVWFQFQFLLHEWMSQSRIVVPSLDTSDIKL